MKSESLFNAIRSEDEQTVASLLAEHPELLNEKVDKGIFDPADFAGRQPAHQVGKQVLRNNILQCNKGFLF